MVEPRAKAAAPAAQPKRGQDVLQALRCATAAAHRQLESDSPLLQPQATQATYFAYLRAIAPLVDVSEAMVLPLAPVVAGDGYDLQLVCRHPLLRADLAHAPTAHGVAVQSSAAGPDFVQALQPHASFGGRFGILYVLEGSTLGGQVLCRELKRRFALESQHLGYLAGHGQRTGARWKQTRSLLEKHLRTPAQRAQACAAAKAMFLLFGRAVTGV